jgi:ABC-type phosphate transport system substrate-binding protein
MGKGSSLPRNGTRTSYLQEDISMNSIRSFFLVMGILSAGQACAEIAVIVNLSQPVPSLSLEEVSKIYLNKAQSFPNGNKAVPIAQPTETRIAQQFNEKVLNKTGQQLDAYWARQIFSGAARPPKVVGDDTIIKNMVSQNPNIIGYINASSVDSTVKTVLTLP